MIALRAPLVCSQRTSAMRGSQNKLQVSDPDGRVA